MTLLVILIALILLRYLHWDSGSYRNGWQQAYCHWIEKYFAKDLNKNGLLGLLLLLTPLVVMMVVVFLVVYHTVGIVGYYILDCVLLWFCLDFREVAIEECCVVRLRGVFGIVFWFLLMGPFGTLVYFTTESLGRYFDRAAMAGSTSKAVHFLQNILDWLPARILGLSVALVSNFSVVMKLWVHDLAAGFCKTPECLTRWCEKAIEKKHLELGSQELSALTSLLNRALGLWLIIILLINVGQWLG
jgi:AmpE protein